MKYPPKIGRKYKANKMVIGIYSNGKDIFNKILVLLEIGSNVKERHVFRLEGTGIQHLILSECMDEYFDYLDLIKINLKRIEERTK